MIICLDTETTGLPIKGATYNDFKDYPNLVQVAYIMCDDGGKELERYSEIVKPEGYEIPKEASDIHKITTEIAIEKGRPLKEVLKYLMLATSKCDRIVGHGLYFDTSMLKAAILKLGLSLELINPVLDKEKRIDTMRASIKHCNLPYPLKPGQRTRYGKWPKLEELHMKLFNEEMEGFHDALFDVEITMKCYYELVKLNIIK